MYIGIWKQVLDLYFRTGEPNIGYTAIGQSAEDVYKMIINVDLKPEDFIVFNVDLIKE